MIIGYARVTIDEQSLSPQKEALDDAGCESVFTDVACGATADRPGLKHALDSAHAGDTLVVVSLDRLGCSLKEVVETVGSLLERGIGLRSIEDHMDTSTEAGKDVARVFSTLSAFESKFAKERTERGRASARARGRKGGRPPLLDEEKRARVIDLYRDPSVTPGDICKSLKISKTTLYRYLASNSDGVGAHKD